MQNAPQKENSFNVKVVTWNLWCMVFSPRALSNPQRCGSYMLDIAETQDWSSYDGLIVSGFQELWSWKTGLFPPSLLKIISYFEYIPYIGKLISFSFQFITLLFGLLPIFKCLSFTYCPKSQLISILSSYLPYSYYSNKIPFKNILDNGLLLLSNKKADDCGFVGYINHSCNDSLAYKGFIYAYFKKYSALVINTHLQSAGDGKERLQQIDEIKMFISKFKLKINKQSIKIILCGDWNVDMMNHDNIHVHDHHDAKSKSLQAININRELIKIPRSLSYANLPRLLGEDYVKSNGYKSTLTDESWSECLDHIFVNFKFNQIREQIYGRNKHLSDHLMIVNDFQCTNFSDIKI